MKHDASSMPTSSASVDDLVVIFCFIDHDATPPLPIVTVVPVCDFMSLCTANAASVLQVRHPDSSYPNNSDK